MTDNPSDNDVIAQAKRAMKEDWRNIDEVCDNVMRRFKEMHPLHSFHLFPEGDPSVGGAVAKFRAYVFFNEDQEIEQCRQNGMLRRFTEIVYEELGNAGRGTRSDLVVEFEFDSDQNVKANWGGSYFRRLR